jgi:hypothetical protein
VASSGTEGDNTLHGTSGADVIVEAGTEYPDVILGDAQPNSLSGGSDSAGQSGVT